MHAKSSSAAALPTILLFGLDDVSRTARFLTTRTCLALQSWRGGASRCLKIVIRLSAKYIDSDDFTLIYDSESSATC